jgi:hypothetical protein
VRLKTVFHVVGLDSTGKVVIRKRCSRRQLLTFTHLDSDEKWTRRAQELFIRVMMELADSAA